MTSLPEPVGYPDVNLPEWPEPPDALDVRVEGKPPEWLRSALRWIESIGKKTAMNAEEARRIVKDASQPKSAADISNWVRIIDAKIKKAATEGERKITNPFHGYRCPLPDAPTWQAVLEHYGSAGFAWREIPGDRPTETFTEISW